MPWIHKVFDLKLAICEVEGMFHMAKELHEWTKTNCASCAEPMYNFLIPKLLTHYKKYFTDAMEKDVIDKFASTKHHDDDDGTVDSHVW
jgi:hypothetical protein